MLKVERKKTKNTRFISFQRGRHVLAYEQNAKREGSSYKGEDIMKEHKR